MRRRVADTALLTAKLPDLVTARRYGEVDVLHTAVTARFTAAMHAIGVKVIVWTADDPADWGRLTAEHVDLITTNSPLSICNGRAGEGASASGPEPGATDRPVLRLT